MDFYARTSSSNPSGKGLETESSVSNFSPPPTPSKFSQFWTSAQQKLFGSNLLHHSPSMDEDIVIEKRPDIELHTVSGRFHVPM